jgi:hypothetical protein
MKALVIYKPDTAEVRIGIGNRKAGVMRYTVRRRGRE